MARSLSGVFLLLWGLAVLASPAFRDPHPPAASAFATGQALGLILGFVLVALGARAIYAGRRATG